MADDVLYQSDLTGLELLGRGKVRDLYAIDDEHLLLVTTDRLSAFDVILPDPIPGKGRILTALSAFWFAHTADIVPNHLTGRPPEAVLPADARQHGLASRSLVVKRLKPLPIEAVVRGYLIGSGWKDYTAHGRLCGIPLPPGLPMAAALPEPIFTPATKAEAGAHDENIDYATAEGLLGPTLAARVRELAIRIYRRGAEHARQRGIIIADTKFEFGLDAAGTLHLIDEVMTPDSSRFWPVDGYRTGISPPSFDKQFVRDWLETLDWDKRPPGPHLPAEIIRRTAEKYQQALDLLTGPALSGP